MLGMFVLTPSPPSPATVSPDSSPFGGFKAEFRSCPRRSLNQPNRASFTIELERIYVCDSRAVRAFADWIPLAPTPTAFAVTELIAPLGEVKLSRLKLAERLLFTFGRQSNLASPRF